QVEQTVNQMAASAGQHAEDTTGMPMHGFADVGVGNHNAQFPQYQGADIAELDFFLTPRLGSRTRALFELNFEVGEDGSLGGALEMNNPGNTRGSTIIGGNVGMLLSGALDGLKVGVNAFQTRIEDQDLTPSPFTRVRSYGVYAAYDTDTWEDIGEFHVFDNH